MRQVLLPFKVSRAYPGMFRSVSILWAHRRPRESCQRATAHVLTVGSADEEQGHGGIASLHDLQSSWGRGRVDGSRRW